MIVSLKTTASHTVDITIRLLIPEMTDFLFFNPPNFWAEIAKNQAAFCCLPRCYTLLPPKIAVPIRTIVAPSSIAV